MNKVKKNKAKRREGRLIGASRLIVLFLVASHFAEQLNERKLNKDKRREGRLIVASRLRIGYIFHKQTKNTTEIYLPLSNATQLSNAPLGVWPCFFNSYFLYYNGFFFLRECSKTPIQG